MAKGIMTLPLIIIDDKNVETHIEIFKYTIGEYSANKKEHCRTGYIFLHDNDGDRIILL